MTAVTDAGVAMHKRGGGGKEKPPKHLKLLEEAPSPDPESYARSYQLECLEQAVRGNTIAFLETGSGKTLIAIMLLRTYAHAIRRPSSDCIAIFLVPTVVLVTQQADNLEMHTDLKIGRFWGDMGVDFWSAALWKEKLAQFEVFVMTPQILLDNLLHSFFKLEKIKLLVFDECHHAKGRHPYACIMKEFFHQQLSSGSTSLPRIFGMTASLINSKGSKSRVVYEKQICELESLMNSKVYTVANESILAEYISYSTPKIKLYKHVDIPFGVFWSVDNDLKNLKHKYLKDLQELGLDCSAVESAKKKILRLHATFIFCLTELGVWLTLKAAESLSSGENVSYFWGERKDGIGERTVKNFTHDVFRILSQYLPPGWCIGNDLGADVDSGFLTTKVECLVHSLLEYRNVENLRCIIFVERVITAIVLQSLLCNVSKLAGWGTKYMAGNNSGLPSQTRKEHIAIVDAFREEKVNIIVATQILEEGLDIQSCNLVVRFDPSPTVCSFIQSRGRARMQGSDYLLIVRSGDSSTLSRVRNYLQSGDIMREESLRQASLPCAPLDNEMRSEDSYCVETTGAIVTLSSSVQLIHFYCSRLPSDGYFKPTPRFVINKESNFCILHLPKCCPLPEVHVEGKSNMLKQLVCLEACKKLHKLGALTDSLLPVFDVEAEVDGRETGNNFCTSTTQLNFFPGEVVHSWQSFSVTELYHCYRINVNQDYDYDVSPKDIIFVVKCNLGSDFATFSFNMETDRGFVAVNVEFVGIIRLSPEQVSIARRFQVCILNILVHQDFNILKHAIDRIHQEESHPIIAYLLLPSVGNDRDNSIDWDCVKSVLFSLETASCTGKLRRDGTHHCCSPKGFSRWIQTKNGAVCSCMLQNSVVYTPHNGHVYCITGIFDELDGFSTIKLKNGDVLTYKEYFLSRHGFTLSCANESLLAGRHLFNVRNFLAGKLIQKKKELFGSAGIELPPELCVVIFSPITISTLYSFSFVPCVMHRIESMLLAIRLKKIQMDHCMQIDIVPSIKILEAITTKKCNEQFSLESLEVLGDSYLKYAASLHLFKKNKNYHEGLLSIKKERMISNATLYQLGYNHELPVFFATYNLCPPLKLSSLIWVK